MANSAAVMFDKASRYGVRNVARPITIPPCRRINPSLGTELVHVLRLVGVSRMIFLAVAVAVVAILSGIGQDEATTIAIELREGGFALQSIELSAARSFPGNEGKLVSVPAGGRLYRLTYRSAADGQLREAYRLANGPFGDRWSFPDERTF